VWRAVPRPTRAGSECECRLLRRRSHRGRRAAGCDARAEHGTARSCRAASATGRTAYTATRPGTGGHPAGCRAAAGPIPQRRAARGGRRARTRRADASRSFTPRAEVLLWQTAAQAGAAAAQKSAALCAVPLRRNGAPSICREGARGADAQLPVPRRRRLPSLPEGSRTAVGARKQRRCEARQRSAATSWLGSAASSATRADRNPRTRTQRRK
jgi:hypothetical protein